MQLVDNKNKISIKLLDSLTKKMFGNLVKAVVDIKKEIMVIDAEMHADEEKFLLERECEQQNLWGINLYPEFFGQDNFVEFDSIINLRPWQNNQSREVESEEIRKKIREIVDKLVVRKDN